MRSPDTRSFPLMYAAVPESSFFERAAAVS
jgi:hypothetical protein